LTLTKKHSGGASIATKAISLDLCVDEMASVSGCAAMGRPCLRAAFVRRNLHLHLRMAVT